MDDVIRDVIIIVGVPLTFIFMVITMCVTLDMQENMNNKVECIVHNNEIYCKDV